MRNRNSEYPTLKGTWRQAGKKTKGQAYYPTHNIMSEAAFIRLVSPPPSFTDRHTPPTLNPLLF